MFRPMRRFKQALSEQECRALLQQARRGVLAVGGDNGYPYAVPMNFYFDEAKGSIFFHCAREGHKLDAILRDEKVCFTVIGGDVKRDDWAWYVKSVIVFGEAQKVTDEAAKDACLRALAKKYFPPEEDVEADMARNAARAAVVEIKIRHMTGKLVHER